MTSSSGTPVTGGGTITSANQSVTGINIAGLPDGILTSSVTITDAAGNVGAAATATATLDRTAPAGYAVTPGDGHIGSAELATSSFAITGIASGDTFTHYSYSIVSDGGGTPVTGTGLITSTTGTQSFENINLSGLLDGKLTYSVTLTDDAGNVGSTVTATAMLDRIAPTGYTVTPSVAATMRRDHWLHHQRRRSDHARHGVPLYRDQQQWRPNTQRSRHDHVAWPGRDRHQHRRLARRGSALHRHAHRRGGQRGKRSHRHGRA